MARKEKKYHYIYKTTNLKNGKFYVGMHSTDNLNDGYLGSGTRLRRSIRKHGKQNFKLDILEYCSDRDSLKKREAELINEDLLNNSLNMNLVYGGQGGFISKEGCKRGGIVAGAIIADRIKNNLEYRDKHKKIFISIVKECFKNGKLSPPSWKGRFHKEHSKQKIGLANAIKQKGNSNSQFGTCWITDGLENKKIKKEESIPEGWRLGRKI